MLPLGIRHARARAAYRETPSTSRETMAEAVRLSGIAPTNTLSKYRFDFFEGEPAIPIERGYTSKVKQARKYADDGQKALDAAADALMGVHTAKPKAKKGWTHPEDAAGTIARAVQGAAAVTRKALPDMDALLVALGG